MSQSKAALARQLFAEGNFTDAIAVQRQVIADSIGLDKQTLSQHWHFLVEIYYAQQDYVEACKAMAHCWHLNPEQDIVCINYGFLLAQIGQNRQSLDVLLPVYERNPHESNVNDALAKVYGNVNEHDKACFHGEQALIIKDVDVMRPAWLASIEPLKLYYMKYRNDLPPFNKKDKGKNIITYSLWGDNPKYLHGAVKCCAAAKQHYPHWTVRIYYSEDISAKIIKQCQQQGAEMVAMPAPKTAYGALFWRMAVIYDKRVDRFLMRDTDSMISQHEVSAVDAWLKSDKAFHIMRDCYMNTELIQAGLWGGVAGLFPDLTGYIADFCQDEQIERTLDQRFLRYYIWPIIKDDNLCHDSLFRVFGSMPFPDRDHLDLNDVAGMNWPED